MASVAEAWRTQLRQLDVSSVYVRHLGVDTDTAKQIPTGGPEAAAIQTRSLYAGPHRMTANRIALERDVEGAAACGHLHVARRKAERAHAEHHVAGGRDDGVAALHIRARLAPGRYHGDDGTLDRLVGSADRDLPAHAPFLRVEGEGDQEDRDCCTKQTASEHGVSSGDRGGSCGTA